MLILPFLHRKWFMCFPTTPLHFGFLLLYSMKSNYKGKSGDIKETICINSNCLSLYRITSSTPIPQLTGYISNFKLQMCAIFLCFYFMPTHGCRILRPPVVVEQEKEPWICQLTDPQVHFLLGALGHLSPLQSATWYQYYGFCLSLVLLLLQYCLVPLLQYAMGISIHCHGLWFPLLSLGLFLHKVPWRM